MKKLINKELSSLKLNLIHKFIEKRQENLKNNPKKCIDSILHHWNKRIVTDRLVDFSNPLNIKVIINLAIIESHIKNYFYQ